jgi:hypothetical protein
MVVISIFLDCRLWQHGEFDRWGCPRPEVTSSVESSTTVSYQCSVHISFLTCTVSKLYSFFVIVDYGGMSISTARGACWIGNDPDLE